jgi:S-formylglutathione hydrolase FrmB
MSSAAPGVFVERFGSYDMLAEVQKRTEPRLSCRQVRGVPEDGATVQDENLGSLLTAGLKPRPSRLFVRRTPDRPKSEEVDRGARFLHRGLATVLFGVIFFAALLVTPVARAAETGRAECNSFASKILAHDVAYCVLLPPGYDGDAGRRFPILYFLHGLGDNEQMFVHSGGFNLVEDLWEGGQIGHFLIATPGAGASFYINSFDGRRRYEDFFVQEFVPFIERHYRVRAGRASRAISGISMGGYGALHLAFRHPELFCAVSAHSAALIEKLPEVNVAGTPAGGRLRILGGVFGSPPDRAFWERNSPLVMARTVNLAGLKIYFDCGADDDYGFNDGATTLDRVLTSRHIPHEFHIYRGAHNWPYFAEHLPASLEFDSRALGLGAVLKQK